MQGVLNQKSLGAVERHPPRLQKHRHAILKAANYGGNTSRAVVMDSAYQPGRHRRFARGASRRVPTVLILCLAACFPAGSLTGVPFSAAVTLPIAGASSAWSYTPPPGRLLAPGAPQASCAARSDWLCGAADAVTAVPDKLYQAAAAAGACAQLSAALEIWRCGGVLLTADTYTAIKSGQCVRSCAPVGVLPCAGAPAPLPSAALPLVAQAPAPGAGLCLQRALTSHAFLSAPKSSWTCCATLQLLSLSRNEIEYMRLLQPAVVIGRDLLCLVSDRMAGVLTIEVAPGGKQWLAGPAWDSCPAVWLLWWPESPSPICN